MSCEFLQYKGVFLGSYYCTKDDSSGKPIGTDYVRRCCETNSYYRTCSKYKESSSYSACYLTTAMCKVLGKEDDCEELETLRKYRDTYMRQDERFDPVLEDYDKIGPIISEKIISDPRKEDIASIMKYYYIDRAIDHINNGENMEAYNIYLDMTLDLMENYRIDQSILDPGCFDITSHAKTRKRDK